MGLGVCLLVGRVGMGRSELSVYPGGFNFRLFLYTFGSMIEVKLRPFTAPACSPTQLVLPCVISRLYLSRTLYKHPDSQSM